MVLILNTWAIWLHISVCIWLVLCCTLKLPVSAFHGPRLSFYVSDNIMKTSSAQGYILLWTLTRQVSVEFQPVICKNFDGWNFPRRIPCSHYGVTAAGWGNLKTLLHSRPLCFSPFQKQWFVNELEKLRLSQGFFSNSSLGGVWG